MDHLPAIDTAWWTAAALLLPLLLLLPLRLRCLAVQLRTPIAVDAAAATSRQLPQMAYVYPQSSPLFTDPETSWYRASSSKPMGAKTVSLACGASAVYRCTHSVPLRMVCDWCLAKSLHSIPYTRE